MSSLQSKRRCLRWQSRDYSKLVGKTLKPMTTAAAPSNRRRSSGGNAPADGNNVIGCTNGQSAAKHPSVDERTETVRSGMGRVHRARLFNIQSGPCESRARGEEGVGGNAALESSLGARIVILCTRWIYTIAALHSADISPFRR